jgi:hypothetical protein
MASGQCGDLNELLWAQLKTLSDTGNPGAKYAMAHTYRVAYFYYDNRNSKLKSVGLIKDKDRMLGDWSDYIEIEFD